MIAIRISIAWSWLAILAFLPYLLAGGEEMPNGNDNSTNTGQPPPLPSNTSGYPCKCILSQCSATFCKIGQICQMGRIAQIYNEVPNAWCYCDYAYCESCPTPICPICPPTHRCVVTPPIPGNCGKAECFPKVCRRCPAVQCPRCPAGYECSIRPRTCRTCGRAFCKPKAKPTPCIPCPLILPVCPACGEQEHCEVTAGNCTHCPVAQCVPGCINCPLPVECTGCLSGYHCEATPQTCQECSKFICVPDLLPPPNNLPNALCVNCTVSEEQVAQQSCPICPAGKICRFQPQTCNECSSKVCIGSGECVRCDPPSVLKCPTCPSGTYCEMSQKQTCDTCPSAKCVPGPPPTMSTA